MLRGNAARTLWREHGFQLARPVLRALAERRLKRDMPVEAFQPDQRRPFTHLEALGRLLCGIAPWLEAGGDAAELPALAREALDAATDPRSPDHLNFSVGRQPLVDVAFLAQALLRAPGALWRELNPRVRRQLVAALSATRTIVPVNNNWVLFASMVEAGLHHCGETVDEARLARGLNLFAQWYVGDGWYGDGPEFHADYYNAYVIQPMLRDLLATVEPTTSGEWTQLRDRNAARWSRFVVAQERMIAPDGSFPVLGRSIIYRGAAFQALAAAAWRRELPPPLEPGQVRRALTAVVRRTLGAPATYDDAGWLRIGLAGHQPSLAETYISTGSLYLCATVLLPLGLPADDPFWTEPEALTTGERAWSGKDLRADRPYKEIPPPS
jgi:hypothetical protein